MWRGSSVIMEGAAGSGAAETPRRSGASQAPRRSGASETQYRGEVVAHDAVQLLLRYRRQAHGGGLLVDAHQLVAELHRVVEEAGVVGAEEDLLQRHERWLAALQEQEEIAPGQRRDQVRQLRVKIRVLGE